ncbi:enoyl-CoA hydratase [Castellaniella caeni]|uniref:enoyl-CoA hydratase n=1 Tax=Castellaniella caeni TaxID=266123 RepID=UPI00083644F6|nr:enoyl-CoA hydratase [Castellaniella caeni]
MQNPSDALVLAQRHGDVLTLTLNRPEQFNALSEAMLQALQAQFDACRDDAALRAVVLAANGRAFCAGHDLKQMRSHAGDLDYYQALFTRCGRLMQSMVSCPVPVIARVQGTATAAGCQLVASCDLAVAADTARFAVSGINVGLFCSTPAVALTRNVPLKNAFEMLVTGQFISAAQAVERGLINHAVPEAELDQAVAGLVDSILAKSPVAVRTGKAMVYRQLAMPLAQAYDYAAGVMARNMLADDVSEGIDAFMEKRPPRFS